MSDLFEYRFKIDIVDFASGITPERIDAWVSHAELLFNAYGILMEKQSLQCLALTANEKQRFRVIKASCNWNDSNPDLAALHRKAYRHVSHGNIGVFIVSQFHHPELMGCAWHPEGQPACTLSGSAGKWYLAHELTHVLLGKKDRPHHHDIPTNIMYRYPNLFQECPAFSDDQLRAIKLSPSIQKL